jgi:hypothetical protein
MLHRLDIGGRNKVVIVEVALFIVAISVSVELLAHIRMETTAANALDILSHRQPSSAE